MEQEANKKKLVTGVTLEPHVREQVEALALLRDWSIAQAGAYLIKLGLRQVGQQTPTTTTERLIEHTNTPQG
jgi:hypothetical protein